MPTTDFDKRLHVTIPLEFPVSVDGEAYETLTIRRPRTKDQLVAGKTPGGSAEQSIFLFALLCGVAPEVIEELDAVDGATLAKQHASFTGRQSA